MRVTHPRRLACFWLAGALSFVAASLHADDAAPHAVVDAPVHDFGTIEQGEAVEHVFRLRNTGTSVLRVDHVKGTCACTVGVASLLGVEVSSPRLRAWIDVGEGNEQRVVVEIDGTESSGRFSDDLVLRTTSARQPTLTVKVLGTIDAIPENDPRG